MYAFERKYIYIFAFAYTYHELTERRVFMKKLIENSGKFTKNNGRIRFSFFVLAILAYFFIIACNNPSETIDNTDGISNDEELSTEDWTWETFDDSGEGGSSSIIITQEAGGRINASGNLQNIPGLSFTWGYAGFTGFPNDSNLAAFKAADAFSFKTSGDGKKYRVQIQTSDVTDVQIQTFTDGCYYQYEFEATETEQTIVIPFNFLYQPWGIQADFNRNNIEAVRFTAHLSSTETGDFEFNIWDLQAGGEIDLSNGTPGLEFTLINYGTAYSVSRGSVQGGHVVIPAFYQGKPVVKIEDEGFAYSRMKTIEIPTTVTSIGESAFENSSLIEITIPDSVTSIGEYVFFCSALIEITIPDSVTSIGEGAFIGCGNLISVSIGRGITSINDGMFNGCEKLTDVAIGENVTNIGKRAFEGCYSLANITIPNSVISIGEGAFENCSGLTSITIPSSVTSIGGGAFNGCIGLTSITIPSSVTSIGYYAIGGGFFYVGSSFLGCTGLTSITVDSGNTIYRSEGNCLIRISDNTLILGCKNSTIPSSVTRIDYPAFNGCTGLTSITIPNSVTSIGSAFNGCTGLTSVTLGTISSVNFSENSFPGDLRDKYFASGGGAGTYVRAAGSESWTKM